jgi:predicted RNase H-like HicB family nuclease
MVPVLRKAGTLFLHSKRLTNHIASLFLQMEDAMKVLVRAGEDGYWVASAVNLPGCISQGRTRDEALANIREAIDLYLEELREAGDEIPSEREAELVEV